MSHSCRITVSLPLAKGGTELRRLTENDRPAIEGLCKRKGVFDVFFLANLDKLGGNGDLVEYWGQFDAAQNLSGVLMRYHTLWYVSDSAATDLDAFAQIIESKAQPRIVVNDNVRYGDTGLTSLLSNYQIELDLSARLRSLESDGLSLQEIPRSVRRATLEDVHDLARFYAEAPPDVRRGADSVRRSVTGERRTFVIEGDAGIAASALTTAELPTLAVIGGLHATPGPHAAKHLLWVTKAIVRSLLGEGKKVCIVTRDRLIDRVCDELGFEDLGPWRIVHMARKD